MCTMYTHRAKQVGYTDVNTEIPIDVNTDKDADTGVNTEIQILHITDTEIQI